MKKGLFENMNQAKPYMDNRELSWLKFNTRVLEEAEDESVPLFERLRFLSIFRSNMDEFFMIRVGSLNDQIYLKSEKLDTKTFLSAPEQLELISKKVRELVPRFTHAYSEIMRSFARGNILIQVRPENKYCTPGKTALSNSDEEELSAQFEQEVLPFLTPSVIDKRHPNHFLKNLEVYAAAVLKKTGSDGLQKGNTMIGIVPVLLQGVFRRVFYLPSEAGFPETVRFILAEDLILYYLNKVFNNYIITGKTIFRITRNADLDVNEAVFDQDMELNFREAMEEMLKKRIKLKPVRIDFTGENVPEDYHKIVSKLNLNLKEDFTFLHETPLNFVFINELEEKLKDRKELFYENLSPRQSLLADPKEKILKQLDKGDILLSYPYESISTFIKLLEEAANDPGVFSIKITLYRVARESKVINALITAAENGKDVLALVELRARFDEENNIGWSLRLEEAGVNVMYGLDDLKVHSKLLLITKKSGQGIKYYTQIGTGNYNERTSRLYTDHTLMTGAQDIGSDASLVFNALSVGTTVSNTGALWVAPKGLKPRVVEMLDTEIVHGEAGYIGLKLNSLTDRDIIEKLAEASRKGVKVELLVRGICCLIAGVPGETENITVTSVVGRFLEHSRVYIFGRGERQKIYISSADFMTRNTEKRVEVAAPVRDPRAREFILEDFYALLTNNSKARIQNSSGTYSKRTSSPDDRDVQVELYKLAYKRAGEKQSQKAEKLKISWLTKLFWRGNKKC
ncbi:MAG: polyphosphate kinase 1 [Oscillospiraceae bacterium]|nr:polyphosphate kinase 1 [Oscillospiraceae bacterium]